MWSGWLMRENMFLGDIAAQSRTVFASWFVKNINNEGQWVAVTWYGCWVPAFVAVDHLGILVEFHCCGIIPRVLSSSRHKAMFRKAGEDTKSTARQPRSPRGLPAFALLVSPSSITSAFDGFMGDGLGATGTSMKAPKVQRGPAVRHSDTHAHETMKLFSVAVRQTHCNITGMSLRHRGHDANWTQYNANTSGGYMSRTHHDRVET